MVTVMPRRRALCDDLSKAISASGLRKNFIAESAGISPSLLSKILSGARPADEDVAHSIAAVLKVDVDTVFQQAP